MSVPQNPSFLPPEAQILQYMSGYQITQVTYTLVKLNVPDHLKSGPKSCKMLASELNLQEKELYRVLRAAVALGLLSCNCDTQTFELTETSKVLTEDHPRSLKPVCLMFGEEHYFAFGKIFKSVQNGKSAFSQYYGKTFFDYLETNKESAEIFDKSMTSLTNNFKDAFIELLELKEQLVGDNNNSGMKGVVVDVGGGEGRLVCNLLDKYKCLNAVVMDLPQVIKSYKYTHDRLTTKEGSFFNENEMPEGDVYLLKHILHDWGDDACVKILTNIKKAMMKKKELNKKCGGDKDCKENYQKIIVIEHLNPETIKEKDTQCILPCLMDLNMLAMCEGGKERTESEFRMLFERGGFKLTKIIPTKTPLVIIEGEAVI
ncbi:hypothetical protein ABK040_010656 [Willaertia magna]